MATTVHEAIAGPVEPAASPKLDVRFPCFDGLRAIAALAVVVYHVTTTWNLETLRYDTFQWTQRLGNFGVSTFFLISGFLLYRPYVLAHFESRPVPGLLEFWKRRSFRIFPAYWVAITFATYVLAVITIKNFEIFYTTYLLLQNYRAGLTLAGLGVEWTLVIELSFYLLLPAIAWTMRACNRPGASLRAKLRVQLAGLAVMYLTAMAVRIWRLWALDSEVAQGGHWFPIEQIGQWIVGYLDWFALGMLLAVASSWLAVGGGIPWVLRALGRYPAISWLLALEIFWVGLQLNLPASIYAEVTRTQSFGIAFVYGLVAFFLILPAVFGHQDHGGIRRFLRSRVMVSLGLISYGIYLWHIIWVKQLKVWVHNGSIAESLWLWFAIVLGLTLVAATLSYFLVERPCIRWSHRHPIRPLGRAQAPPAPSGPPSAPAAG